jgi:hypothetical protein
MALSVVSILSLAIFANAAPKVVDTADSNKVEMKKHPIVESRQRRRERRLVKGLDPRIYEAFEAKGSLEESDILDILSEASSPFLSSSSSSSSSLPSPAGRIRGDTFQRGSREALAGYIDDNIGKRWWFTDDLVNTPCDEYFRSSECFVSNQVDDGHDDDLSSNKKKTLDSARALAQDCKSCYYEYDQWEDWSSDESYFADCQSCNSGDTLIVAWTDCLGFCVSDSDVDTAVSLGFSTLEDAECWLLEDCYDDDTVLNMAFANDGVDPFFDDDAPPAEPDPNLWIYIVVGINGPFIICAIYMVVKQTLAKKFDNADVSWGPGVTIRRQKNAWGNEHSMEWPPDRMKVPDISTPPLLKENI